MKKGFITNIEKDTLQNNHFRKVLYTGEHLQLVTMSLQPGEDIGLEVHNNIDQFIRIEQGTGIAYINGIETEVSDDFAIIIPARAKHNITNTGDTEMKLYTIYGPAEHKDDVIHNTKIDSERDHENDHFDGVMSE